MSRCQQLTYETLLPIKYRTEIREVEVPKEECSPEQLYKRRRKSVMSVGKMTKTEMLDQD